MDEGSSVKNRLITRQQIRRVMVVSGPDVGASKRPFEPDFLSVGRYDKVLKFTDDSGIEGSSGSERVGAAGKEDKQHQNQ